MRRDKTIEAALDTGRANEYMLAYVQLACNHAGLDDEVTFKMTQGMRWAFDMFTSAEALEESEKS